MPQLTHLHMRYLRRLSDRGVDAITASLPHLSTLDLSFCTRITPSSIQNLLEVRGETIKELRLFKCRRLGEGGMARFAIAARSQANCVLDLLDVRECGSGNTAIGEDTTRQFALPPLNFRQPLPGFFVRQAVWNKNVKRQLVAQTAYAVKPQCQPPLLDEQRDL
jgi:hypothetical protein